MPTCADVGGAEREEGAGAGVGVGASVLEAGLRSRRGGDGQEPHCSSSVFISS